jgi:hypothetical protein
MKFYLFRYWSVISKIFIGLLLCLCSSSGKAQSTKGSWDSRFCSCGVSWKTVESITKDGDKIYLSGSIDSGWWGDYGLTQGKRAGFPTVWDGKEFSVLGGGVDPIILTNSNGDGKGFNVSNTIVVGDSVIVIGLFESVGGGVASKNVAFWNKKLERWDAPSPMPTPYNTGFPITASVADENDLFIAGHFQSDTNEWDYSSVLRYNFKERKWHSLGLFTTSTEAAYVTSLSLNENNLYVAGTFTQLNYEGTFNHIARWDRDTMAWRSLDFGYSDVSVNSIAAVNGDTLYATWGSSYHGWHVQYWAENEWHDMGTVAISSLGNVVRDGSTIYLLGIGLMRQGNDSIINAARWDGTKWVDAFTPLKKDMNPYVVWSTSKVYDGVLYEIGSLYEPTLRRFNGSTVVPIDSGSCYGINGSVSAMVSHNDTLYIAGSFSYAGGVPAPGVAFWDGKNWNALGELKDPYGAGFGKLIVYQNKLYAADFGQYLWYWMGDHWETVGENDSNMFGAYRIHDLAIYRDTLIIGGTYDQSHSNRKLAKWDGKHWSYFDDGDTTQPDYSSSDQGVFAVAGRGNDLFIGGNFTKQDGDTMNSIAQWNGIEWSPIVTGNTIGLGRYDNYSGGRVEEFAFLDTTLIALTTRSDIQKYAVLRLSEDGLQVIHEGTAAYDELMTTSKNSIFLGRNLSVMKMGLEGGPSQIGKLATSWNTAEMFSIAADSKGHVFVGGLFQSVNGKLSSNFAMWTEGSADVRAAEDQASHIMTLSPNPCSTTLHLLPKNVDLKKHVRIFDGLGITIASFIATGPIDYDTRRLANAVYYVEVEENGAYEVLKFVVSH